MTMMPISANEAQDLIDDEDDAEFSFAEAFGIGGGLWNVERAVGGDRGPATLSPLFAGPISLFVVNTHDYVIKLSPTETEVPDGQWRFITVAGYVINPNDVLTSIAAPEQRYVIVSANTNNRVRAGIVERLGTTKP